MAVFGITKPVWRSIIVGIMAAITIWTISRVITRSTVSVPSNHEYMQMDEHQRANLVEYLDSELGEGNYKLGLQDSKIAEMYLAKALGFAGLIPKGPDNPDKDKATAIKKPRIEDKNADNFNPESFGFSRVYVISPRANKINRSYMRKLARSKGKGHDGFRFDFIEAQQDADIHAHVETWERVSSGELPDGALIIADNADINRKVREVMPTVHKQLRDLQYNILFLSNSNSNSNPNLGAGSKDQTEIPVDPSNIEIYETDTFPGSVAYAVSQNGARLLLEAYNRNSKTEADNDIDAKSNIGTGARNDEAADKINVSDINKFLESIVSGLWITSHSLNHNLVFSVEIPS